MTCTTVRRAAGSLGRPVCGDNEEADQCVEGAAPRARRVERVGGTSGGVMPRPGRPRGGRARVVVGARPVVRHTRPTPRAADCRPAASGTPVSRSAACACSPCGDPQTSGWSLPLRWSLALRWWPRAGEWRLVRASPSRGRPRPASVLTGRASLASGRRTGPARYVAGGGSGLLRPGDGEAGGAPRARRPSL